MKKNRVLFLQIVLLLWFFLDMTGFYFGGNCLVTRSYQDDGIFFLIYLVTVILFAVKENIGKWFSIAGCRCGRLFSLFATNGIPFSMVVLWEIYKIKSNTFLEQCSG